MRSLHEERYRGLLAKTPSALDRLITSCMTVRMFRRAWWVDIRYGPKRHRKKSPENSRSGALAYEAQLRQRLARGEPIDRDPKQHELTFEQFAWRWFNDYVLPNNRYHEQRMKKSVLQSSLIPFFGKIQITEITAHHVEQFKAKALINGASGKTVNNRLAIFRKCIATAYDWLKLPGAAPNVLWLKCPPCRTDYLSADECDLLLSN